MTPLKLVLIQMSNTYWQWYIQPVAPPFNPELALYSGSGNSLRKCVSQARATGIDWTRIKYTYLNRHATTAGE